MLKNSQDKYGSITKALHWLSALTIVGLFGLGYWMVGLDYYSEWYQTAPHWHESIGIMLLLATGFRFFWRLMSLQPKPIESQSTLTQLGAKLAHIIIYLLLFIIFVTGYLVPTADDRAIKVFDWFTVPSLGELFSKQEDLAGLVHEYVAYGLIILAVLHGAAALKHHFIDKDDTLTRML